jgi:hypothetical protein
MGDSIRTSAGKIGGEPVSAIRFLPVESAEVGGRQSRGVLKACPGISGGVGVGA